MRSEEEKVKIAALWRLARVGGLSFGEEGLIKFRAWHPHVCGCSSTPLVFDSGVRMVGPVRFAGRRKPA